MPTGFFLPSSVGGGDLLPLAARCGACKLCRGCRSPKMTVSGEGRRRMLVVAEAPGEDEDEQGTQLVGRVGKHFRKLLKERGVDLDWDCWRTNALACRPKDNTTPTDAQIEYCRPNVVQAVERLKPVSVLLLGKSAVESVVGYLWRRGEGVGTIGRWVGWRIPCRRWNAWLCPTWHPSYLLRENDRVLDLWFGRHLDAALAADAPPWPDGPPKHDVECIYESGRAAKIVRGMVERGGPVAFDYETDRLKPDAGDSHIVSCAVCWRGKKTIAFPWHGEAVCAMDDLLSDPKVKKYGANIKFEERWTMKALGHGVAGWEWDTMLASHVLDCRRGITGLKFGAFTRLGVEPYDADVSPFLKAASGNERNRIGEADLASVLKYNGFDALYTYQIAEQQMGEM